MHFERVLSGLIPKQIALLQERYFDYRLGIDTCGNIELETLGITSEELPYGKRYQPVRLATFARMMRVLDPDLRQGRFVDFGCGKGRALILAHRYGFGKLSGVEFSHTLLAQCEKNLAHLGIDATLMLADAGSYAIPPDATLFYCFNPFSEIVLQNVAHNILQSLAQHPREAVLAYVVPVHHKQLPAPCFERFCCLEGSAIQPTHLYRITAR